MKTSSELTLRPVVGLAGGMTIQFAVGRWPEQIAEGVAMRDPAFDLIEPCLAAVLPGWTPDHRWGVYEIRPADRPRLVAALRTASGQADGSATNLFLELAVWLEQRLSETRPISILGY